MATTFAPLEVTQISQGDTDDDCLVHIGCEHCLRWFCDGESFDSADDLVDFYVSDDDCLVCDDLSLTLRRCPHCGSP